MTENVYYMNFRWTFRKENGLSLEIIIIAPAYVASLPCFIFPVSFNTLVTKVFPKAPVGAKG